MVTAFQISGLWYFTSALKMLAVCSCAPFVSTRHYKPEDKHLKLNTSELFVLSKSQKRMSRLTSIQITLVKHPVVPRTVSLNSCGWLALVKSSFTQPPLYITMYRSNIMHAHVNNRIYSVARCLKDETNVQLLPTHFKMYHVQRVTPSPIKTCIGLSTLHANCFAYFLLKTSNNKGEIFVKLLPRTEQSHRPNTKIQQNKSPVNIAKLEYLRKIVINQKHI